MAIKFLSGLNLSNVTAGSILKLDSNGNIVAAVDGTDYNTASSLWSTAGTGGVNINKDVRIGTFSSDVLPEARLHVYAYQTTDPKLLIEDGNTGDASMEFKISTQSYTMGIDNSDSDKFILAASSALGTTNVLEISTTGASAFQGDLLVNGTMYSDAADISGRLDVASDLRLRGNAASIDQGVVRFYTDNGNHLYIDTANNGTQVTKFGADGSLTIDSSGTQGLTIKQSAALGADIQVEIRGSRNAPSAGINPAKLILSSYDSDDGSGVVKTGAEFYMEATSLTDGDLSDCEVGIRYRKDGSVVDGLSIHDGQITAHGDLLVNGGNIIMGSQYGVRFNDANTRIYTNNDNPEDLIVEADQNLHLNPDGSILAQSNISMEGGSIITTDSNNALVLRSDVQHGQGDEDAVISFKQSTTEHAKIDQDGYMYATGFKTTTASTGLLKADGTVDTTTLGTMASASTGDYKDSDAVETYVGLELASYTLTSAFGSNAFTSYTDHSTQGYLTSYTETDTLDSVTGRGATTTNNISIGNLTAVGGAFTDPVTIYDSLASENPRLSVGRSSGESIQFDVTDVVNTITAKQDSDSDGDHTFVLDRVFAGAGDSIFTIQNDGTPDLTIDGSGVVSFNQYNTAGILKVNTSGTISVDTSSYLTSYTETDTLSSVVSRGASTTTAITTGGITADYGYFGSTSTAPQVRITTENATASIADTFADTSTDKSYIYFQAGTNSNDPGYIMHETSESASPDERNEGVLHLVPSDDNSIGDYVSIHGTNDADVLRLHTSGLIETATGYQLVLKSGNAATKVDDTLHVTGRLYVDTLDANTTSTSALVEGASGEIEKRTLGSNAFTSTTIPTGTAASKAVTDFVQDFGTTSQSSINTIAATSGKYRWNNQTEGRPAASQENEYGTLLHLNYDGSNATQLAHDIDQNNLWIRHLNTTSDTGTAWKQIADTAYVTTAISNLVDSAPAALDTLNELAAALGDDASFSTTMSTALGNRLRIDVNNQSLSSTELANARTNLGLGSAATTASTAYATAAQGATADAALPKAAGSGNKLTDALYIQGTNTTSQESVLIRGISSNDGDWLGSIRTANTGGYNQEMRFYTSNANGTSDEDLTLTLHPTQNATFASNIYAGGDLTVAGGDVTVSKQNDAPTLTLLHDGTNPSTNDLLFKMQFQSDYDGTHQNWGKIELDTNTSAVRTNMDFHVKSASGSEQLGFRIEGQPSATPKAYFYNAVDVDGALSATNLTIADALYHEGDTNTSISFGTDTINFNTGGGVRATINDSGAKFNNNTIIAGGSTLSLGERAEGDDNGRTVLIEGVAAASSGEGSGRIFFTEHNSTDAAADKYGLSLYYEGNANAQLPSGCQPNTGNATWSLRRHDNSVNGAAIMSGTRSSNNVTFSGTVTVAGRLYATTVDANATSTTALVLGASNEIEKRTLGTNAFNSTAYLEDISPATPSVSSATVVGETIEIAFAQSSTPDVDYYQVWSAVGSGGSYGMIAHVPQEDVASSMTVIDATFDVSDTIYYRVYAVKSGIYSTAGTINRAFSSAALDVSNMSVVNLNTAYYIQYEMPDSRFVDHVEIYMDAEASAANLTRTGATLVYSGNNTSYMYKIGANDLDKYHQFWVEVVES